MNKSKILIVEDEPPVRQMIAFNLHRAGFEVDEAVDVASARVRIADNVPDLVLIDWMLPDSSGLELTRALKREEATKDLAIIMLTARAEERSKILGLDGGADDYVIKPFSARELISRINAVLRRSGAMESEQALAVGELELRPDEHRLMCGGDELQLGPTEYKLLSFFMRNPERVYSREQILDNVWGRNVYIEERTVDVHVQRLRKALQVHGADKYVQTVRGAGYRFSPAGSRG
ncbi:MAG: phosphate regulon transcriptional regulator PhoB [Gammaproteobacteria bacterium]|nr:phosphate regulon transcriptional regulator PhoB [Gammaproteobacteria bacterium]NND55608.1 phosphate regulon transcriptional regulator PhoB [Gammaproteobacteria bacterium]